MTIINNIINANANNIENALKNLKNSGVSEETCTSLVSVIGAAVTSAKAIADSLPQGVSISSSKVEGFSKAIIKGINERNKTKSQVGDQ